MKNTNDPKEWLREVQAPSLIEAAVAAALERRPHDLLTFMAEYFSKLASSRIVGEISISTKPSGLAVKTEGPECTPRPDDGALSNIPNHPDSPPDFSPQAVLIPNSATEGSPKLLGDVSPQPQRVQSQLATPLNIQEQLRRAREEVARLEALLDHSPGLDAAPPPAQASMSVLCAGDNKRQQVHVLSPDTDDKSHVYSSPRSDLPVKGGKKGMMLGRADTALKKGEKLIGARACVVCGRDDRAGEERKNGFKCHECVGLPSNPRLVKKLEEADLHKGRTKEGEFVVNDYTIIRELGRGAYGKVRLVHHNVSGQCYAVKVLPKSALKARPVPGREGAMALDPVQRAKEEVKLMAGLKHPNVVQIYGTMEGDHELMIIMEALEGPCYPSHFPAEPLPLPKLQKYWVGISKGLEYLHENGIIHRDIKPDNILLDQRDNIKLTDFGVSQHVDSQHEGITGFMGTPTFMPPEAFDSGAMQGEPADVWAFGVTAYAMAFGKLPPWGNVKQLQTLGDAIRAAEIEYDHSCPLVDHLLKKMLKKEPGKRMTVDGILQHPLFQTIRIVKGQPVEHVEVTLDWNKEAGILTIQDPEVECENGKEMFIGFFDESGEQSNKQFQIVQNSDYSIILYDVSRDPRRERLRETLEGMEAQKLAKQERKEKEEREKEGEAKEKEEAAETALDVEQSTEKKTPATWMETGVEANEWDDSDLEDGL